uniref:Uncharacterized protein n=1 Tax=Glossina austeni TaxID=7395 RepID=A0A1A9UDA3_GLOAU
MNPPTMPERPQQRRMLSYLPTAVQRNPCHYQQDHKNKKNNEIRLPRSWKTTTSLPQTEYNDRKPNNTLATINEDARRHILFVDCRIIEILALDFVLAKPWCAGLDVRYCFMRGQDLLDSEIIDSSITLHQTKHKRVRPQKELLSICDHNFHRSCPKAFLNNSQLCPNCQTNLPGEDIFGQILTRQQSRLLDGNKAVMANTPDLTPQSQSLSPEVKQHISEMVLSSVQAQQSKFLQSLTVTMSEMV